MSDSFDAEMAALVREIESPEEQSRMFAAIVAEEIAEARRINRRVLGADAPYTVAVDGRQGAPLSSIRANSTVVAEWSLIEETLEWIRRALISSSPRRSGRYARSHVLFVNGVESRPGEEIPAGASSFTFLNVQPYARKLEGDIGRRGISKQNPDGIYQAVAALADRRFADVAEVRFGYEMLTPGVRGSTRADRPSRQPAIFVKAP